MRWLAFAVFTVVGCLVRGVPLEQEESPKMNEIPSSAGLKGIEKCSSQGGIVGIINCAAIRVLRSIEKADQQSVFEILPGVALVGNTTSNSRTAKTLKEDLPTEPMTKSAKLLDLILESGSRFMSGRVLKIKLPENSSENIARALEEGRGKMKKMMGPLMLGLGAKMLTMVPIMMSGLGLLAAKALMIGKLAFVVSMILFVQYFFSGRNMIPFGFGGGGGGYTPYGYGTYGGGGYGGGGGGFGVGGYGGTNNLGGWGYSSQYPYARSLDVATGNEEDVDLKTAQDFAYSGQKQ